MAHGVQHCVVNCSDWRLTDTLAKFIGERGGADRIEMPGGVLPLTQDVSRELTLGWIRTLYQLHHFTTLHLVDHTDCGGYRLTFPELSGATGEQEIAKHRAELQAARVIISNDQVLAGLTVKTYLYDIQAKKFIVD